MVVDSNLVIAARHSIVQEHTESRENMQALERLKSLFIFSHLPCHNVFDFACLHATEDLKLFVLGLLPDARRYQHLRETVEVEAHASHVQLFVRVPLKA